MAAWETEDVDEEERLLQSECEETSGDEMVAAPDRSVGRIAAMTLMGAAALACVLGVSGTVGGARVHLRWGAVSAGFLERDGLDGISGGVTDAEIYATTTAQTTTAAAYRYGEQVFDANMKSLAPKENKNDGNLCGDDEEEFEKACFKTCSDLTNGEAPYRTSPFSCCKGPKCRLKEERINVLMCAGFDVAGDAEGKSKCPHTEGVCLADEELHLGMCYKKCSALTSGEYAHRSSAITCCKYSPSTLASVVKCLHPTNIDTKAAYSVGGGVGDEDKSTPNVPHAPMPSLTENSKST